MGEGTDRIKRDSSITKLLTNICLGLVPVLVTSCISLFVWFSNLNTELQVLKTSVIKEDKLRAILKDELLPIKNLVQIHEERLRLLEIECAKANK